MSNQNTNTAVQTRASALSAMAQRFNVEPVKLMATLKNTVFKNASDDELMALVIVANEYNLNPFKKEIYAFPAKGGGIVPIVGVDGWINIMNSHPQFDGVEFQSKEDEKGNLISCAAIIHRKDRKNPTRVEEFYSECKRNTDPWNTMPRRMLRNRALAQAVRIAFTAGGIIDEDEAQAILDPVQSAKPIQATVVTETAAPKRAEKGTLPSKRDAVGAWMTEKRLTWERIQPILEREDIIPDASKIASFDDLNEDQITAIFGARTGMEFELGLAGGGK